MAFTVADVDTKVPGSRKEGVKQVTLDTYATNGIVFAASDFGFSILDYAIPLVIGPTLNATVNNWSWDQANLKLKLYNGTTEVTNATDVSAFKVYFKVRGV